MERQGGGLEGVQRQAGDACGDFISHPCTGLNMLPRSYKSVRWMGHLMFSPSLPI